MAVKKEGKPDYTGRCYSCRFRKSSKSVFAQCKLNTDPNINPAYHAFHGIDSQGKVECDKWEKR